VEVILSAKCWLENTEKNDIEKNENCCTNSFHHSFSKNEVKN
jgi:hypothetical protein